MAKTKRFTIYDKMNQDGVFESNPANATAYPEVIKAAEVEGRPVWPVPYPRMLYHPQGERRVIVAGEVISTPMGPKEVGRQTEIVWKTVNNEREHRALLAEGWHETPVDAAAVAGGRTPEDEAEELNEQIKLLELRRDEKLARANASAGQAVGTRVKAQPKTPELAAGKLPMPGGASA